MATGIHRSAFEAWHKRYWLAAEVGTARVTSAAVLVTLFVSFSACRSDLAFGSDKGINAFEHVYFHLARRVAASSKSAAGVPLAAAVELCQKIDPEAIELQRDGFLGSESWSYSYKRSYCFQEIAAVAGAPELCDQVRILNRRPTGVRWGREIVVTPETCRAAVGKGSNWGTGPQGDEMILLLLGYTHREIEDGTLRALDDDSAWEFLSDLLMGAENTRRGEDFARRLARLPDFSNGDGPARRQLDLLVPGWTAPTNTSFLVGAVRCAIERGTPKGPPDCSNQLDRSRVAGIEREEAARRSLPIDPPVRLSTVEPVYPARARSARIEGTVVVEVMVTGEGKVGFVKRIIRSIPELDQAAIDAVRQYTYRPAVQGGTAVGTLVTESVTFTLK